MRGTLRFAAALGLALLARDARPLVAQADAPPSVGWQVTLDDDRYVWDVRLVRLAGDTLIVRQSDSLLGTPVARIRELRMFQKTQLRVGDEHESAVNALTGAGDRVYDLGGLDVAGRRRAIHRILSLIPPGSGE